MPFHHEGMLMDGGFFHCSVQVMSHSAGRSVVAAAAYRTGEVYQDRHYDVVHDYTRRHGVECSFTVAPEDAPAWAHDPEALWNAAESAEKRKNSCVAREVELALPAFLSPQEQRAIVENFAGQLVERYGVAVTAAIHEPGRHGDERNFHAHVLFSTREMESDGFGKKTRILDDRKTGPGEIGKIRELAAECINKGLAAANSDIRVDHRSFKERGIEREPTTHLGPAASEMERRGETSERGDFNRHVEDYNALLENQAELEAAIAEEHGRSTSPPRDRADALERMHEDAKPVRQAVQQRGSVADIQSEDELKWWQRAALRITEKTRNIVMAIAEKARYYWQTREGEPGRSQEQDLERER